MTRQHRTYLLVYFILLAALVVTVAVAYVPMGRLNTAAALAIALAKVMLVVLFFMHVREAPRLTALTLLAGLVWLTIMLTITASDYLTRSWISID